MKSVLQLAFICCISIPSFCQSTTEAEYNYMKRGYAQIETSGLDLKRGYFTEVMKGLNNDKITVTFTKLLREKDKSIAGIIVKSVSSDPWGSGTKYWAIPAVSKEGAESYGWDLFFNEASNLMSPGVKDLIFKWIAYRMSYEMNVAANNVRRN
ncbi:MAG TPA: hypothetical protein VK498_12530 [Ferruginibacter sp.]|nr:hypothetical protein [Ferruginibacter sp.]